MRSHAVLLALALVMVAILVAGCTNTGNLQQSRVTPTTPLMPASGSPVPPEKLVAFVEKAYEYAHEHGQEAALREFNNQTGRFVEGELYIFAYDPKGNTLALPFQPDLLGKNRWNVTDANGTAFIQEMVETAQSGGGFVHYLYSDPSDNFKIKPKLSYVMMVDQDWLIGSGIYEAQGDDPIVRVDPQVRESLKSFVGEAITYAKKNGKDAAIREFNDRNGTFVSGNLYIYAFDYNGTTLALPYQPQLIGTDLSGLQDPFGVNYTKIEIFLAKHGGGFIFYHYLNPARDMTLEPKMSYVQKVDDTWWLGAGIYLQGTQQEMGAGDLAAFVQNASAYAAAIGEQGALAEFSRKDGKFSHGNVYVYAYDYNGTLLAHPYLPEKIGSNLINKRDPFGMETIRALANTARTGGGYIVFIWPNPGKGNREELKIGYVLPVDGTWWVGSGVYLSEIIDRSLV